VYHAVDRFDPNYEGAVGFTKRPVLLDPIEWDNGWPMVRGGLWASDEPMPAPAAQPDDEGRYDDDEGRYNDEPRGSRLPAFSDNFSQDQLSSQWSWVREPAAGTYAIEDGQLRFDTQAADLFVDRDDASILTREAPAGDYVVETKVTLNLPPEGCCFNFVQAGLVIYGDDDNYIKLVHASIFETRQTEFAKEVSADIAAGGARYGNTVVGSPTEETWLLIHKRTVGDEEHYTPYTKREDGDWVRGGTWTHKLGSGARIGLVSMGGTGFTAKFDYVRVYRPER
jgi:arabinan endo-1,5-alpha-L-arabinosidase